VVDRTLTHRAACAAGALIVLGYFLFFVWHGLSHHFAEDDMMNIHYYWSRGPWALLRGLVLFFTTYNRPIGGVFYFTLFHFFGLNPLPYHIAITCLLLLNVWLMFRFAGRLSGSPLLAGLCALAVAYHAQLAWLVYLPSFIYDVLCFTFYLLAFNYYLAIRGRGVLLSRRQVAVFLLLSIAALEAKEMAVTLPVMVLLYEWIWHRPSSRAWLKREAVPALLLGGLTGVYILGKTLGPDSLTAIGAYTPEFSVSRYFESTSRFLNTLFYQPLNGAGFFQARWAVLLLAALLGLLAWRIRDKHFRFACLWILIVPLPITFVPGRGGGCLYLPLAGWAMVAATLFLALCGLVLKAPLLRRLPAQASLAALVLAGVALFWVNTIRQNPEIMPSMEGVGRLTWVLIQDFRTMQPHVKPGSTVAILDDPYWGLDIQFIAELTFRDHSVRAWVEKTKQPGYFFAARDGKLLKIPATPGKVDYLFAVRDRRLVRLRAS
jgi:hypothetical protein